MVVPEQERLGGVVSAGGRAQEIAVRRASERRLFGSRIADLGMAQAMIADSEIDIAAARARTLQTCWDLETVRASGGQP